jgi:hypothetical protein
MPPQIFNDTYLGIYVPDLDLWQWCLNNFLNESSALFNEDHMHLSEARIGFIWTNDENSSKGRRVVGQAEQPMFRCGKWQKGRQEQQMLEWFSCIPDFVITLDANYCLECSDTDFLMLLEHEIYHCSQALDDFGSPKFNKNTGEPSFAMRGHDVEEFIGVVARYGVGNPQGNLAKLVVASQQEPSIASADISKCCGTCLA